MTHITNIHNSYYLQSSYYLHNSYFKVYFLKLIKNIFFLYFFLSTHILYYLSNSYYLHHLYYLTHIIYITHILKFIF